MRLGYMFTSLSQSVHQSTVYPPLPFRLFRSSSISSSDSSNTETIASGIHCHLHQCSHTTPVSSVRLCSKSRKYPMSFPAFCSALFAVSIPIGDSSSLFRLCIFSWQALHKLTRFHGSYCNSGKVSRGIAWCTMVACVFLPYLLHSWHLYPSLRSITPRKCSHLCPL